MHEASVHAWTPSCDMKLTVFGSRAVSSRRQHSSSVRSSSFNGCCRSECNNAFVAAINTSTSGPMGMMNSTIEVIEISARTQASAGHLAAFVIRYALSIAGTLGKRPALPANPQATGTANRIFPRAVAGIDFHQIGQAFSLAYVPSRI